MSTALDADVKSDVKQTLLILPGYQNSGPGHWQSLWQAALPNARRVEQADWENPDCAQWLATLEKAVRAAGPETILVAHSLGCLLVAQWAAATSLTVHGALLVAVPEPGRPLYPTHSVGFAPVPLFRFPFPSVVVASTDDSYGSFAHASKCASEWGSRLVSVGNAGHINADSGFGEWPQGRQLLRELAAPR